MDVKKAIEKRRAYRSLDPVEITRGIIEVLAHVAQIDPCTLGIKTPQIR